MDTEVDMVNSPAHYAEGNIETIDYIVDVLGEYEAISYCHGDVIKLLALVFWGKGNPIQDAQKAVWYLNKMIELMEKTKVKTGEEKDFESYLVRFVRYVLR